MMKPYNYMFLRYRQDVLSGEFVNIGLVYYSNQDGFLKFKKNSNLQRVKNTFRITDLTFIKNTLKSVEEAFFLALDSSDDFPKEKTIENFASQALARDHGSFIWSKPLYGVTPDHNNMFEDLFSRFITQYNDGEKSKPAHRDDSATNAGEA